MVKTMIHRGPDYSNYIKINDNITFGHNRLKILDLSDNANQPMSDYKKRFYIVFNGEIYNFKEIKKKVSYPYKTKNDTKVILASILKKGVDWFVKNANGMFAIGIYYNYKDELYLIRDRFGVKPLFYSIINNETLVFASEIKAIISSNFIEPKLNDEAVDLYLGFRYPLEPYTFFENIYQVPSSHILHFYKKNKKICVEKIRYWSLPQLLINPINLKKQNELLLELEKELLKAVKIRLISDVPVGTYLSGGLDSSFLTATASILSKKNLDSYTIGFKNFKEHNDEFIFSDIISKKYNLIHHKIFVEKKEYLNSWDNAIFNNDSPLSVPNEILLTLLSKELKKKITVVLSGEGADELFWGYGRIMKFPFYYEHNLKNKIPSYKAFLNEYYYFPENLKYKIFKTNTILKKNYEKEIKKMFEDNNPYQAIAYFFHNYHIKGLLKRLDSSTMIYGVEGRTPFLDYKLVEFVYKNIPIYLKIKWRSNFNIEYLRFKHPKEYSEIYDVPKYCLKKIAEKYFSKSLIYRKKIGFPIPLNDWFDDLIKIYNSELKKINNHHPPFLKIWETEKIIKILKNSEKRGYCLWMLINLVKFYRIFFIKK